MHGLGVGKRRKHTIERDSAWQVLEKGSDAEVTVRFTQDS
jgi:hypothetical protein